MSSSKNRIEVTGMGVITPIGIGLHQFTDGLKEGKTNFSLAEFEHNDQHFKFPIGKVNDFNFQEKMTEINLNEGIINKAKKLRNISVSAAYGVYCALEAWADAGLQNTPVDLTKVAIVSGGTNTQQASLKILQDKHREKLQFMNPNYGLNFFDTDIIGILSEVLAIKGEGHSIGAASASGNMAIIQGSRLISSKEYDVVIVVAPLMDLSIYEYQGFTTLGAMAGIPEGAGPAEICKPFDAKHCGFVYGQSSGCLILESGEHAAKRGKHSHGSIAGYGINLDANRSPNPSVEGEQKAMQAAMMKASVSPKQISYINTHGTASVIGDITEVEAILSAGLEGVKANSTKSLIGHGLTAAGVVESIAGIIQLKENFLHPSHNLINPISDRIDWIKGGAQQVSLDYVMSNSFGFGGVNTSVIIKNNLITN
jgi:malonyl-ACP decarboxylase